MLKAAELSRSTYYYQLNRLSSLDERMDLAAKIRALYHRHRGRYGYRRITAALRQAGERVNHKAVQRRMATMGLKSLVRIKKYKAYRGVEGEASPNQLDRKFRAEKPNQKWATDITEFKVAGQRLYLSPVMDLFNGEIVAYDIHRRPMFAMVQRMLAKAVARLRPGDTPLLHSDQGWQYRQPAYRSQLAVHGITQSMSRKATCLDNAAMESFFGTLKAEYFYLNHFDSIEDLEHGLEEYIHYYNHERIKLKLGGLSPVHYRTGVLAA